MMNSQELESRYASLKQAKDKGNISDVQFRNNVGQLRLKASDGVWYQIDPDDGRWLKWDGKEWQRAAPPAPQQQVPQKFLPLLVFIIESTIRVFRQQLPMMIFFGILGWLLHTFLLVFVNQGFGDSTFVGKLLVTRGNSLSGTIIWMVGSGLVFGWVSRVILKRGPKGNKPRPPAAYFKEAKDIALVSLAAGAGVSLVIGIAANGWANFALAAGFGGLFLSQGGSVVALLIRSAWSSTYGLVQSKRMPQFGVAASHVALAGCALGFVMSSILPTAGKVVIGLGLLAVAFVLARRYGTTPGTAILSILPPLVILIVAVYLIDARPVLADDGGWQEAGGTFGSWIGSSGAITAMLMGIGPGIGTMLGPALLQALNIAGGNIQLYDGGGTPTTSASVKLDDNQNTPILLRRSGDVGDKLIDDVDPSILRRQQEMFAEQAHRNLIVDTRVENEARLSQVETTIGEMSVAIASDILPTWITENEIGREAISSLGKYYPSKITDTIRLADLTLEATTGKIRPAFGDELISVSQEDIGAARDKLTWEFGKWGFSTLVGKVTEVKDLGTKIVPYDLTRGEEIKILTNLNSDSIWDGIKWLVKWQPKP